ncbi:MAG: hypothetical protein LBU32_07395, partial [Clostridiales bacterium]|nr:hypothetical protein [Clostridiales bacterium]
MEQRRNNAGFEQRRGFAFNRLSSHPSRAASIRYHMQHYAVLNDILQNQNMQKPQLPIRAFMYLRKRIEKPGFIALEPAMRERPESGGRLRKPLGRKELERL